MLHKPRLAIVLSLVAGLAGTAHAQSCNNLPATISGNASDNTLIGTAGNDRISGGPGGNNRLEGRAGDDMLCGGPGNDEILGEEGDDLLFGGAGDDLLQGGPGNDVLYGGPGLDTCDGGEGINTADSGCEVRLNLANDVFPVTLLAPDGTALDGELYVPTGAARDGIGTRRVAMVIRHGAQGTFAGSVPTFFGLIGNRLGFTVLALNGRDFGESAGDGNTLFEDNSRDFGVAIDYLETLGYDQVFIAGHSGGTGPAGIYPTLVEDPRLVGVGLYGAVRDGGESVKAAIFSSQFAPGLYESYVAQAEQLVADGQGEVLQGWPTVFGPSVFRTPRTFLSYWGPDTLQVLDREIVRANVPYFLLRADGDEFTPGVWSEQIRDAAVGAGVDATYQVIPYDFPLGLLGGNAHSYFGVEAQVIQATVDWLVSRVPAAAERDATLLPLAASGNYLPAASAGPDQVFTDAPAGTIVTLDGSKSLDLDGSIAGYNWVQVGGTGVSLTGANTSTATFEVPAATSSLAFELTVTDDQGDTAAAQVAVQVNVTPPPPAALPPGRIAGLSGSAIDPVMLGLLALLLIATRRRRAASPGA